MVVFAAACCSWLVALAVVSTAQVPPKLAPPAKELSADEGSTATIFCSLASSEVNEVRFEWLKEGELIEPPRSGGRTRIISDAADSRLKISNVSQAGDEATYVCRASNEFGTDEAATKLNVKGELNGSRSSLLLAIHSKLTSRNIKCDNNNNNKNNSQTKVDRGADGYESRRRQGSTRALLGTRTSPAAHRVAQARRRKLQLDNPVQHSARNSRQCSQ